MESEAHREDVASLLEITLSQNRSMEASDLAVDSFFESTLRGSTGGSIGTTVGATEKTATGIIRVLAPQSVPVYRRNDLDSVTDDTFSGCCFTQYDPPRDGWWRIGPHEWLYAWPGDVRWWCRKDLDCERYMRLFPWVLACTNLRSYHSLRDLSCCKDQANVACRELEVVDLQSRIAHRETASSLAARVELSLSGTLAVPAAPDMCGAHVRQTVQVLGETFNLQHGYAAPSARLASALDIMNYFSDSLVGYDDRHGRGLHASLESCGIFDCLKPVHSEVAFSARLASALDIMNSFSDSLVACDDMHGTSLRASLDASGIFECLLPVHNEGPAVAAPALQPSLIALPPNVPAVQMCRSRTDKASSRAAQSTLDKARALAAAELLKRIEAHDAKSEKEKRRLQACGDRTKAQLAKEQALRVACDELADAAAITHARDRNYSAANDAAMKFELLAARGRESALAGKLASLEAQLQHATGAGVVAAAEETAEGSSMTIEDGT